MKALDYRRIGAHQPGNSKARDLCITRLLRQSSKQAREWKLGRVRVPEHKIAECQCLGALDVWLAGVRECVQE